jgi:hypothetical protein
MPDLLRTLLDGLEIYRPALTIVIFAGRVPTSGRSVDSPTSNATSSVSHRPCHDRATHRWAGCPGWDDRPGHASRAPAGTAARSSLRAGSWCAESQRWMGTISLRSSPSAAASEMRVARASASARGRSPGVAHSARTSWKRTPALHCGLSSRSSIASIGPSSTSRAVRDRSGFSLSRPSRASDLGRNDPMRHNRSPR